VKGVGKEIWGTGRTMGVSPLTREDLGMLLCPPPPKKVLFKVFGSKWFYCSKNVCIQTKGGHQPVPPLNMPLIRLSGHGLDVPLVQPRKTTT